MRVALSTFIIFGLFLGPIDAWAAQDRSSTAPEKTAWKAVEALVVKKHTRLPEPAVTVPYDEVESLERQEGSNGMSIGKAIGVGVAAGAGAILTIFVIMLGVAD